MKTLICALVLQYALWPLCGLEVFGVDACFPAYPALVKGYCVMG